MPPVAPRSVAGAETSGAMPPAGATKLIMAPELTGLATGSRPTSSPDSVKVSGGPPAWFTVGTPPA